MIYYIDKKSPDKLFFDAAHEQIIGVLPDTSNFFGVLYFEPGDDLYPSLITLDKNGFKIDDKRLCYFDCPDVDCSVDSCFSFLDFQQGMTFLFRLRMKTCDCDNKGKKIAGTAICIVKESKGHVSKTGKIILSERIEKCN